MKDLLRKGHYCSKIHTLIMTFLPPPYIVPLLQENVDSSFYDFSQISISIPINKGGSLYDGCNETIHQNLVYLRYLKNKKIEKSLFNISANNIKLLIPLQAHAISSEPFFQTYANSQAQEVCVKQTYLVEMWQISRENINCKSRSYSNYIELHFRLFCTALGYHLCVFWCTTLSQNSDHCPEQIKLFVSFCQHLVPDLILCQHDIGQSLRPASEILV